MSLEHHPQARPQVGSPLPVVEGEASPATIPADQSPRIPAPPLWALGALYALAILLRAWRWASGGINHDTAITGLMGLDILDGRWPVFFWGQDWMGSLDAYLAAPIYAALGPSALALNFLPFVCSVGLFAVTHRVLRRLLSPTGVLAGLAVTAVPPATYLFYAGHAVTHYPLGLLLAACLLWLTLAMHQDRRATPLTWLAWGFLAGLGAWTNFMTLAVTLPAALFLALFAWRLVLRRAMLWGLLGLVIGAAPLIAYNLSAGGTHLAQAGLFAWEHILATGRDLLLNALPIVLGANTPATQAGLSPWGPWFLVGIVLLAGALAGTALLARDGRLTRLRGAWLVLAVAGLALAAVWATPYGRRLGGPLQNYFLPLYLVLPLVWGRLAQGLGARWGMRAAAATALAVVLAAAAAYPGFRGGVLLSWPPDYVVREEPAIRAFLAEARQQGLRHLYARFSHPINTWPVVLSFLGQGRPQVADLWQERRPWVARSVDAAVRPGFLAELRPSLDFLGLPYDTWRGLVHTVTAGPDQAGSLLPRDQWRAGDLAGRDLDSSLSDGNLATLWRAQAQEGGQGVVLDLGRTTLVSGLSLFPAAFNQIPPGLSIAAAGESRVFDLIRTSDAYWGPFYVSGPHPFLKARYGRIDCYFPPRPVRYLRITGPAQGRAWSLTEVLAYGPDPDQTPSPDWEESARLALEVLAGEPVRRLYADAWASARLGRDLGRGVWSLASNLYTDAYGGQTPPPERPPLMDPGPGSSLVVDQREAPAVVAALDRAGLAWREEPAGRLRVFFLKGQALGPPVKVKAVLSEVDQGNAAALAFGRPPGGRWGSQGPQRPGLGLDLVLDRPSRVAWIRLAAPHFPSDFPRRLGVLVSDSGQRWTEVEARVAGPLVMDGPLPWARPGAEVLYHLEGAPACRRLRLELRETHPVWWWSLEEVAVFAPPGDAG